MSIASRITSIENHIENAYDSLSYMGETTTDKNIENISGLVDNIYNKLPKVSNSTASSNVTLNPTLKGRIDSTLKGQIGQEGNPSPENEIPVKSVTGENTVRVKSAQLIDFASKVATGYSFENDMLVYESSQKAYAGIGFDITDLIKNNPNKKIYFVYKDIDVSNQSGNVVQLGIKYNDQSPNYYAILLNHNLENSVYTIPNDTRNISAVTFAIFSNNTGNSTDNFSVTIIKPQLLFDEPQEKELDLGELEVYENGYFSRENGKWYLNNEWGKYIFNNDLTQNGIDTNSVKLLTPALNIEANLTPIQLGNYTYSNLFSKSIAMENYTGLNGTTSSKKIRISLGLEYATTYAEAYQKLANLIIVYPLETPSKTEITNPILINQLEEIYKLMSYDGTTIIETECETGNLPILVKASANVDIIAENKNNLSWKTISNLVKSGQAERYFKIGDQITTTWKDTADNTEYEVPLDVVAFQNVTILDENEQEQTVPRNDTAMALLYTFWSTI